MSGSVEAFAVETSGKINWLLRVLGKRDDGFHEIETVFQTVSLSDRIVCEPASELELTCSDPLIPVDSSNLVLRAFEMLDQIIPNLPRFRIHIEKTIPSGGGLGGGSSNAAGILREIRNRFAPDLSDDRLERIALELGSDVPFFLSGGTAYATGRGEKIEGLPSLAGIRLLLAFPEERVSTAEAYEGLKRGRFDKGSRLGFGAVEELVAEGPLDSPDQFVNEFEEVIFERFPALGKLRERMILEGASWARMSGSGSTIVGAFRDEETRMRAARSLRDARVISAETTD